MFDASLFQLGSQSILSKLKRLWFSVLDSQSIHFKLKRLRFSVLDSQSIISKLKHLQFFVLDLSMQTQASLLGSNYFCK